MSQELRLAASLRHSVRALRHAIGKWLNNSVSDAPSLLPHLPATSVPPVMKAPGRAYVQGCGGGLRGWGAGWEAGVRTRGGRGPLPRADSDRAHQIDPSAAYRRGCGLRKAPPPAGLAQATPNFTRGGVGTGGGGGTLLRSLPLRSPNLRSSCLRERERERERGSSV